MKQAVLAFGTSSIKNARRRSELKTAVKFGLVSAPPLLVVGVPLLRSVAIEFETTALNLPWMPGTPQVSKPSVPPLLL